MRYKNIPGTDLYPSSICLGTGAMGSKWYGDGAIGIDREHSFQLLDTFVEMGGNFIDTAHVYGDWVPGEKSLSLTSSMHIVFTPLRMHIPRFNL